MELGKTTTETYNLLRIVYGDDSSSRTQVFEWFKKFKEGREGIEDDPHSGHSRTSKTDGNVGKIREIIRKNRGLSIRVIAELMNINKETVRQILHENLEMKKVCAKIVPKLLNP